MHREREPFPGLCPALPRNPIDHEIELEELERNLRFCRGGELVSLSLRSGAILLLLPDRDAGHAPVIRRVEPEVFLEKLLEGTTLLIGTRVVRVLPELVAVKARFRELRPMDQAA